MSFLSVILAAVANFAFGAIWYMSLAKPWMAASGVEVGEDGRPANNADPIPYITSFVAAVLVAGMMRHVFALSAIDSFGEGALAGFGIGLFLVTPWIATFYGFGGKPRNLLLIDGGYATIGCSVMGAVLMLL
ncbi:MAG: DUF1761 domain-containing protein [Ascidiaceihabitans sp.]|nr:DUF1761 domain-containing protein [Ascidiaceihabitans sp.]